MIETMLDLSSAHIPPPKQEQLLALPEFGSCRWSIHKYGWIVFVCAVEAAVETPGIFIPEDGTPEWLIPIMNKAIEHKCMLINFDQDGPVVEEFQTYAW